MSFTIDRQTLEELNLLGKFRQGSVYHLFNRVRTAGGERLLDDMFRHPLSEAAAINRRSATFRYFQETMPPFPFEVAGVASMREYLDVASGKSALVTFAGTVLKKTLSSMTRDERHKRDVQGLQATIGTLHRCREFAGALASSGGAFDDRVRAIRGVLSDKRLEALLRVDVYQAIPLSALARYEHLLRSTLHREMEDVLSFIAETDVYTAVAQVAVEKGFTYADALGPEADVLSATGLYHPCLDNAVGNAVSLDRDRNILFLTGANMAGKSTLMKAIGIGLYLAHMGFPVAADAMSFSMRDGLYTSINVSDNIGLGYSHFYAEVVRVRQAADAVAAGGRLLLMFDELFKGTNVKDAYDGTLAITEAFSDYRDCLFIVSTHIIEVGEALKAHRNIHFAFMPTVMDGPFPRYPYTLREGITEDRQGMMIIRNEGILELIGS